MDNEKIKEIQKSANDIYAAQVRIERINEILSKIRGHNLIRVDLYLECEPIGHVQENPIIITDSSISDFTKMSLRMTDFINWERITLEKKIEEITSKIEIVK